MVLRYGVGEVEGGGLLYWCTEMCRPGLVKITRLPNC